MTINIEKFIGIKRAAKFPIRDPAETESPIIKPTPDIAIIIAMKLLNEIFSFRKKYPKTAKNKVWLLIIKTTLAIVVSVMPIMYPTKLVDKKIHQEFQQTQLFYYINGFFFIV